MMTEKICPGCGKTKLLHDFPTRGRETDRFGKPVYKKSCKACESGRKLKAYYANKDHAKPIDDDLDFSKQSEIVFSEYVPKSKKPGRHVSSDDDYGPWTKKIGRELTDDEKYELDACARELIIAMQDLVVKERERKYEEK